MAGYLSIVRFEIRPFQGNARELIPFVDDVSLVDLIAEFESHMDDTALGGYAGPVLEHFRPLEDLEGYLFGHGWPEDGRAALLGCSCGELGCWPLYARIRLDKGHVIWDQFTQPFRPQRDYSGFGAFVFGERQYRMAVAEVAAAVA